MDLDAEPAAPPLNIFSSLLWAAAVVRKILMGHFHRTGMSRPGLPAGLWVSCVRIIKALDALLAQPTVRFEPTYRVEPVRPFRLDRAAAMVRSALETGMADAAYSEQWAADACRILAAYITQCVKSLETPRSTSLSIERDRSAGRWSPAWPALV